MADKQTSEPEGIELTVTRSRSRQTADDMRAHRLSISAGIGKPATPSIRCFMKPP